MKVSLFLNAFNAHFPPLDKCEQIKKYPFQFLVNVYKNDQWLKRSNHVLIQTSRLVGMASRKLEIIKGIVRGHRCAGTWHVLTTKYDYLNRAVNA